MVVVEVAQEVPANVFAQCLLDKFEVGFVVFSAKGNSQEPAELLGDVIRKPVTIEHGDDVISVSREGGVRDFLEVVFNGFTLVSKDKTGLVEGIATKHAANSVGDELADSVS